MHRCVELDVKGCGALALTKTRTKQTEIKLPRSAKLPFLVFQQPSGSVVAKVGDAPTRSLSIDMPLGRYMVQRREWRSSVVYQFRLRNWTLEDVGLARLHDFLRKHLRQRAAISVCGTTKYFPGMVESLVTTNSLRTDYS